LSVWNIVGFGFHEVKRKINPGNQTHFSLMSILKHKMYNVLKEQNSMRKIRKYMQRYLLPSKNTTYNINN
jgi:hypothetical protein